MKCTEIKLTGIRTWNNKDVTSDDCLCNRL